MTNSKFFQLVIGFVCLGLGILGSVFLFSAMPSNLREMNRVAGLQAASYAAFTRLPEGSDVLVHGTLQGNLALEGVELVAYDRQMFKIERDSDDELKGDWETIETFSPALQIAVEGGRLQTRPSDTVTLQGRHVSDIVEEPNSNVRSINGIREGSVRLVGFQNGDAVTVVGKIREGALQPERIFSGTPADLTQSLRVEALIFGILGALFLLIALGIGLFVFVRLPRAARRTAARR